MNQVLAMIIIGATVLSAEPTIEQIETIVEQIHTKRNGLNPALFDQIAEPFVKRKESNQTAKIIPVSEEPREKIALHAILNKKAFIADRWHKEGDMVGKYRLVYIGKSGVVLKNKHEIKRIFLKQTKQSLIMTKEGTK